MIHFLQGRLVEKRPTEAVLDVHGVGFTVAVPTSTFEALPAAGAEARLLTHLHVREDLMQLFGFATRGERAVFESMMAVSGIGPRLALAALSAMRPVEIQRSVLEGDAGFLTRIPGVGRKTAERMVIELRDRLGKLDLGAGAASTAGPAMRSDALAALEALGFSKAGAEKALRTAEKAHPEADSAETLIRFALRDH